MTDKKRDSMIAALRSIDEEQAWYDDDDGLEIFVLTSEGLYEGVSQSATPIEGPFILDEEDLNQFHSLADDEIDDFDFDGEDALEMIRFGCQPGVNYYKWGQDLPEDDDYHEWEEIIEELTSKLIEDTSPTPWEEMDDGELVRWIGVQKLIKDGYLGWGELSEEGKNAFTEL